MSQRVACMSLSGLELDTPTIKNGGAILCPEMPMPEEVREAAHDPEKMMYFSNMRGLAKEQELQQVEHSVQEPNVRKNSIHELQNSHDEGIIK